MAHRRLLRKLARVDLLAADPAVSDFVNRLVLLAGLVQRETNERYGAAHPRPLAEGAVWTLFDNTVSLQRANLSLCQAGWAFACAPVLRSQIDCVLNLSVVVASGHDQDYMGFKYTHGFIKNELKRTNLPHEDRSRYEQQIQASLGLLRQDERLRAREFLARDSGYWHAPEYTRPSAILGDPKLRLGQRFQGMYESLSAGAHGGLVGLRAFRDAPDTHGPYPRKDPKAQNLALIWSGFLTLRCLDLRIQFEQLPADATRQAHESFQTLQAIANRDCGMGPIEAD